MYKDLWKHNTSGQCSWRIRRNIFQNQNGRVVSEFLYNTFAHHYPWVVSDLAYCAESTDRCAHQEISRCCWKHFRWVRISLAMLAHKNVISNTITDTAWAFFCFPFFLPIHTNQEIITLRPRSLLQSGVVINFNYCPLEDTGKYAVLCLVEYVPRTGDNCFVHIFGNSINDPTRSNWSGK